MTIVLRGIFGAILLLSLTGPALAVEAPWFGTLEVKLGSLPMRRVDNWGGVVAVGTVNATPSPPIVESLRLSGGLTLSDAIPVTDPDSTATLVSIRMRNEIGPGTITGISGAPPLGSGKLPLPGFFRLCLFAPSFCTPVALDNTANDGNTGFGVGGQLTAGGLAGYGGVRVSLVGQPWTLGTATAVNQTAAGGFKTLSRVGFIHGPFSMTSTAAMTGGVIQLVAPQQVMTTGIAGNRSNQALFSTLRVRFIAEFPEPHSLLLLGAGVIGLALVGRARMRQ